MTSEGRGILSPASTPQNPLKPAIWAVSNRLEYARLRPNLRINLRMNI